MTASLNVANRSAAVEQITRNLLQPIVVPAPRAASPVAVDIATEAPAGTSFHVSRRVVIAVLLATVLLSTLAVMVLTTIAPQGIGS